MMRLGRWLLLVPLVAAAQTQDSTQLPGRVTFVSEPPGAEVMVGDVVIGRTPVRDHTLSVGGHRIRLAWPSFSDWSAVIRKDTLNVQAGAGMTISHKMGAAIRVVTVPAGVEVLHAGRFLGTTPLIYRSDTPLVDQIVLRKAGFYQQVLPQASLRGVITLKVADPGAASASEMIVERAEEEPVHLWGEYVSAAGLVLSGVAAAYFKHQANKHFEVYRNTGSPSALEDTRRNDRYSGVFLVVTQLSLGALTYLLLGAQ